jgi:Zn-dependent M16 (insulinase) family peptidase
MGTPPTGRSILIHNPTKRVTANTPSGFKVLQSAPVPRLEGHFYDLLHEKTGARHVHLAVPDRNNYFCALYRTLPPDDTGVAHIMEHCVSGGSRRFPPGAGGDMYGQSLVTDINATTNADFTNYYFASRNRIDFRNWSEYIVDVSLYPRMAHDTYLRQRGHFEFNDPEDPESGLKFVGIIFNEMKAVFGSPARHAFKALHHVLFPGHPYAFDSGGVPADVPKLTYEGLLEFNRRFYQPANAFFLSRGDIPLEEILERTHEVIGSDYPTGPATEIPEVEQLADPSVKPGFRLARTTRR